MTIAVCSLLLAYHIACSRSLNYQWDSIKNLILGIGASTILIYWLFSDGTFHIAPSVLGASGMMAAWWVLCTLQSKRMDISMPELVLTVLCMIPLLMKPDNIEYGMAIVCFGAVINCICAWLQRLNFYVPSIRIPLVPYCENHEAIDRGCEVKRHYLGLLGYIGNSNMLGAYLVPCFFLSLYLAQSLHWVWMVSACLIGYTILGTECKAALIALFCGMAYFVGGFPLVALVIIVTAIVLGVTWDKLGNTRERINYWRVALAQVVKTPLFGLGFNVFRSEIPFLQRDIHEKDPEFLKQENYHHPYPGMCHNDYLQAIVNNGLPGLCLLLAVPFMAWTAPDIQSNKLLLSALIGFAMNGLFFHSWHIPSITLMFWLVVASLSSVTGGYMIYFPIEVKIVATAFVLTLLYRYVICRYLGDMFLAWFMRKGDAKKLYFAYKFNATGTYINQFFSERFHLWGDTLSTFVCCIKSLVNYDGETMYWDVWNNMGGFFMSQGDVRLASMCFRESLYYRPESNKAKERLEECDRFLSPQGA